ncbi:2OG-Fe dioxygenase family protein [Streptomyces ochraceiscleroticus]|uniref:2OG-Fe dioxygenase family protein n=1 Tax=Streptomyces ochraceiscleroticus TaxID=47761 RepID=A0ABW1MR60_9ACTN|nr:2OG-Fe dioxygenase family protein [Streptomyces ochraceiscleroticus]
MDRITDSTGTADGAADPAGAGAAPGIEAARTALAVTGAHLMPPATVRAALPGGPNGWARFAAHWEDLSPDPYAAAHGTRRLRRYGHFTVDPETGEGTLQPHTPFLQPEGTNHLYETQDRHFDPLTDAFLADPVLHSLLELLGKAADALARPERWQVKVHPFRVSAAADGEGQPTPEGRHRDGVTLVTSLLIGRENATGGQSTVYATDGREVLSTTLREPAALLLSDDRSTLHGVSPIRPVDAGRPARRDVLVITYTAA